MNMMSLFLLYYYSQEQLGVYPTKQTPVYDIQFTSRNLCLVSGAFTLQKEK